MTYALSADPIPGSMRVSCPQERLSHALSVVGRAVGGRTTLPALNNVLLASDGDRLRLSATNLEIGITTWLPARVEGAGAITAPLRLLSEFVGSLPSGQPVSLELAARGHSLHLESGRYTANVKGIDADEFPPLPTADDRPTFRLRAGLLREMIAQVAFTAAREESRPVLTGVNLRAAGDRLTLSAADGFRLSTREASLERALPEGQEALDLIVPARALQELARLLSDSDGDVEATVTANRSQIVFRVRSDAKRAASEVHLVSRLLEGQYPDLQRVTPKSHTTRVVANRAGLVTATRIASLFARDAANLVRLDIARGADGALTCGRVTFSAAAAEVGDNRGELDATVEGEEATISFSALFLSEVLAVLDTDEIAVEISGPLSPAVIRAPGIPDYTHVLMPLVSTR